MISKWTSIVSSLLAIACTTALQGQQNSDSSQEEMCGESKRPMRVTGRHIESNGIGYNQGYSTLEGFFSPITPWGDDNNWVPFLDLRGHVFNNKRLAANAGIGLRYVSNYVYGINAYYDYRNSHRQHYNQFAAGLEALGKIWDFRINGYLPVGRKNSSYYETRFGEFKKHSIFLSRKKEVSLKGANAEVGYHVDHFEDFPFYFAGGAYYLHGTGRTAWGGQLRARVDIYDYLTLDGNVSYDHLFQWVGQGQVSLNLPLGERRQIKKCPDRSCTNSMALSTRALQRVDRFEIIPVDHKRVLKKAIDPTTGDPYVVWFVDNTSHSQGTYESPFNTLVDAQNNANPNDIIYVFVGDGTSNGMNAGITLKAGQQLLGAGVDQYVATTRGTMKIPAHDYGLPTITDSFSPETIGIACVSLIGGNNVVSGFNLLDTARLATGGKNVAAGLRIWGGMNYLIKNNILSSATNENPALGGGNLMNIYGGGNVTVQDNTFICLDDGDSYGVDCDAFVAPLEGYFVFDNNLFTGANANAGLARGLNLEVRQTASVFGGIGTLNYTITNNTFNSQKNITGDEPAAITLILRTGNTVNMDIIGNNITMPAGIANPHSNEAGILLFSAGPGTAYCNLQDNVSLTVDSVPGYTFNSDGNVGNLNVTFDPNNIGTVTYIP